jgi:DNA polymerase II large subunit
MDRRATDLRWIPMQCFACGEKFLATGFHPKCCRCGSPNVGLTDPDEPAL